MPFGMAMPLHAETQEQFAHPAVYLLADHLDGVLAAGEDLLGAHFDLERHRDAGGAGPAETSLPAYVSHLQTFERTAVMHALQARQRVREVRNLDPRFGPLAGLFLAGTTSLADASAELGDTTDCDFRTGNDVVSFLRSRAIIASDVGSLDALPALAVTEGFRIAGCIELGPLLDLVSTFASVLDQHYELYSEDLDTPLEAESLPDPVCAVDQPTTPDSLQERLLHISNMLAYSTGPSLGSGERDAIRDAVPLRP